MKQLFIFLLFFCLLYGTANAQRPEPDTIDTNRGPLIIQPIHHGTLVLSWNGDNIYIDPTGGKEAFEGIESPGIILITHAHGDHMDVNTLQQLDTKAATLVVPKSVADQLPETFANQLLVLANGDSTNQMGFTIRAVPMYNLPESSDAHHPKGWGNGYVVTLGGKKIYISGDTEDIPEMRSLKNIDVAFVCMNLPYTMDVEQAAQGVLAFKPKIIYPYHYRGQDTEKFKELVNAKSDSIEVRLKDWYSD